MICAGVRFKKAKRVCQKALNQSEKFGQFAVHSTRAMQICTDLSTQLVNSNNPPCSNLNAMFQCPNAALCNFNQIPPTSLHFYSRSKSSSFSLYRRTFLLILLPSTHVTKSSMLLVTKNAVSVIVSGPTRTWPCSIIFVAA